MYRDEASTRHPIFLARACGHVVAVNSKAMELAGVTRESAQPSDGRFQTDSLGEPLGIFEENAISMVKDAIPAVTAEKVKEHILEAVKALNSFSITSVHTDDFLSINGSDYIKIGPLKIIEDGSLGARTAFLGAPCADKPDTWGSLCFLRIRWTR